MDILNNILLFVHFFGVAMGLGAGLALSRFGTFLAGVTDEHRIRSWGLFRTIRRMALTGLGLLIATGLILVFSRYGGPQNLNAWFWAKMAFVLVQIATLVLGGRAARRLENGDRAAAALAKRAGMIGGIAGLLVIFCAVFAFN